ncbi:HAMP domain-containing methyl-accepting chemotaxis protein [Caldibacillus lycopersici]|uniref:HAMP domain-containing methyl-accepting chemotaxis protein n=1 Tax=Perspicuibacillus lycopersici TaxID=1325689 RepID=A0AAE3ITE0_9BACI|nr:HAMP domain-containing methyl-accepting chemotaxis protein [Perspicuibacillus lycopersici]MCU9612404.1 HAMP domain-containing methyl-accepting chemotaxis protein [Perspicuibacillus lycopersici]
MKKKLVKTKSSKRTFFKFKSLKAKILSGFSFVLVLVLALFVLNFFNISKTNDETEEIVDEQMQLLITYEKMSYNVAARLASVRGYMLYDDMAYRKQFNQYAAESDTYADTILSRNPSPEEKALVDKSVEWQRMIINEVYSEYSKGNKANALQILSEKVQPLSTELIDGFDKLSKAREGTINTLGDTIISDGERSLLITTIVSLLVIIVGIGIAITTSRSITNPIRLVMKRMKQIAEGDLSNPPLIETTSDEVGQLVISTNAMNANMRNVLMKIQNVSETVSCQSEELSNSASEVKEASEQVASTMQELASGSEAQANNSIELSSMMEKFANGIQATNVYGEQIEKSSNNVLDMTNNGSRLMESSTTQMAKIDEIVQEAVEKVQSLNVQSQQISKLVIVIKEIADQTNLLALNAAIEAARAGEHGRGFAVVADEVRKLAEQVAFSVKDITKIVSNIESEFTIVSSSLENGYKEVAQGTSQIKTTNEMFHKINHSVSEMANSMKNISDNLSSIAESSQEMEVRIQEIAAISEESAAGIEQTSAAAQQTNSSMEEIANNSTQLSQLAEELNVLVKQFKI